MKHHCERPVHCKCVRFSVINVPFAMLMFLCCLCLKMTFSFLMTSDMTSSPRNGLIHLSIRIIPVKNYEIVSKFVKVMPEILWSLFFWTRCSCTTAAVYSELHDQLASLERHGQLTRCFSAVAELLVYFLGLLCLVLGHYYRYKSIPSYLPVAWRVPCQ